MNLSTRNLIVLLLSLVVAISVISVLTGQQVGKYSNDTQVKTDVVVPPITDHMRAVLEKSSGFDAFVSYTNDGFQPQAITVKKGQVVRFTNNSSRRMWISAQAKDGAAYPVTDGACGQSDFDSCKALPPHEIWEFTFDERGTWSYRNNVRQRHEAMITVQ